MLVQMIFSVECSLLKRPLVARLVVVSLKMVLVRLGLAAEHTAHASSLEFECSRTVQSAYPLFDWQM